MSCKVCKHPHAAEIMSKVFDGSMSYMDAAKQLNLAAEDVWKCFADHWQMETTENGVSLKLQKSTSSDDYVDILKGLIKKLVKKLDGALRLDVTPMNVGAMTKLSAESRALMRDILDFQGKLEKGPLIQLNVMQIQMTKLTNWLINNLPQDLAEQLFNAIPELITDDTSVYTQDRTSH